MEEFFQIGRVDLIFTMPLLPVLGSTKRTCWYDTDSLHFAYSLSSVELVQFSMGPSWLHELAVGIAI